MDDAKEIRNANDRARRAARKLSAQNEGVETTELEEGIEFKDQIGTPANAHAKKIAQAKSRKKAPTYPIFYTRKGLKVLKLILKPGKTVSVYIGSMAPKKHKAALEEMILKWSKDGIWLAEHEAKAKCAEIQAKYEQEAE